jgi:(E)-4-hydroxy-3-methylbut-2-enyl-diphosphate synthase
MTNTDTLDTDATVRQCMELVDEGCEMVRITAQGTREAGQLEKIKNRLVQQGYRVPLIADIHFNPKAAEVAAAIVEKVRINPGNYVTRTGRASGRYSDEDYREELEIITERMAPLVEICRKHHTVIRIGVNHGSLAERVMQRFGATTRGMVESAIEYARICESLGFENLLLSIKSSDVKQTVYANRLLMQRMIGEGMDYPLHLGVTEAGDGEDGRIKSAAGIGALLADGIGDTIRVSLTEDPVNEIPVARMIAGKFAFQRTGMAGKDTGRFFDLPLEYARRPVKTYQSIGGQQVIAVSNELLEGLAASGRVSTLRIATGQPFDQVLKDLPRAGDDRPLLVHVDGADDDPANLLLSSSAILAKLLIDGYGDALRIETGSRLDPTGLELGILQAVGLRISRTEYIACPSCGRTQFDIQDALEKVRRKTAHLPGLKIAVMGCIVNGPGEMADDDYGYVGSGRGRVSLYKGRTLVKRNIEENAAVDELIELIKEHGDWKES